MYGAPGENNTRSSRAASSIAMVSRARPLSMMVLISSSDILGIGILTSARSIHWCSRINSLTESATLISAMVALTELSIRSGTTTLEGLAAWKSSLRKRHPRHIGSINTLKHNIANKLTSEEIPAHHPGFLFWLDGQACSTFRSRIKLRCPLQSRLEGSFAKRNRGFARQAASL